ncbi:hypothetical protein CPC08DRAFT_728395 [Agrocybe pediades]|nr:hypothetical protein CPC08DRAFT_728395 [Agrocybe pediades]
MIPPLELDENRIATIHVLDSILLSIFLHNVMRANHGDELGRTLLDTTRRSSQVCARWRMLMLASPGIWVNLFCMDSHSPSTSAAFLSEVLRRSGTHPLYVDVTLSDAELGVSDRESLLARFYFSMPCMLIGIEYDISPFQYSSTYGFPVKKLAFGTMKNGHSSASQHPAWKLSRWRISNVELVPFTFALGNPVSRLPKPSLSPTPTPGTRLPRLSCAGPTRIATSYPSA